jgi:hypothetical protein
MYYTDICLEGLRENTTSFTIFDLGLSLEGSLSSSSSSSVIVGIIVPVTGLMVVRN